MLIESVDRLFVWVRSKPFFLRFVLFTRILLAAGFVPTGMVKLLGRRFTLMPVETPIGAFFEAMYQTGLYWQFLGAAQVAAGLLLLVPRWAHLGALFFMPIMLNIFVVTVSLGFKGTPAVTGLMLLAVTFLCAWDYHRFRGIFTNRPWPDGRPVPRRPFHAGAVSHSRPALDRLSVHFLRMPRVNTLPWMILCAGLPAIMRSRANSCPQRGQRRSPAVRSSTIRSTKHLTSPPVPPLR
jgi:hypothetical protein